MTEPLPDVELSPEQEARANAMADEMSKAYWGYRSSARVIVHLQDENKHYKQVAAARWQPIETAPVQMDPILMTDGKWFAAGHVDPDGSRKFSVYHFAVSQEYDWTPTHWMPLPGAPQTTGEG